MSRILSGDGREGAKDFQHPSTVLICFCVSFDSFVYFYSCSFMVLTCAIYTYNFYFCT